MLLVYILVLNDNISFEERKSLNEIYVSEICMGVLFSNMLLLRYMTGYQESSPSNCHQGKCPFAQATAAQLCLLNRLY